MKSVHELPERIIVQVTPIVEGLAVILQIQDACKERL